MNAAAPSPRLHEPHHAFCQACGPLLQAGILEAVDVHVADQLGMVAGEHDPEVLLALALVVRAPRHGHICVDLAAIGAADLVGNDFESATKPLPRLPEPGSWVAKVSRSPLVLRRGEAGTARPFVLDGTLLYADRYFRYQERMAAALLRRFTVQKVAELRDANLLKTGLDSLMEAGGGPGLDRQRLGAAMALLRGLTVISGGPGTGKTYTVRSVLALLWAQWAVDNDPAGEAPGPRVALAAPTGKAASRLKESIQKGLDAFLDAAAPALPKGRSSAQLRAFLDGLLPSTVHRLLRWNPANPTRFRHNAADPVPFDIVVIDETSMVDFALMAKLVDAVAPHARLILLGDQHQLSSVEAGTVLADLCGPTRVDRLRLSRPFVKELSTYAGFKGLAKQTEQVDQPGPCDAIVQLDRSRRFSSDSGIALFARQCLAHPFDAARAVGVLAAGHSDVTLLEHGEWGELLEAARQTIRLGYAPYLDRLRAGSRPGESREVFHRAVLDELERFRILCAHRRGRVGVEGMNEAAIDVLGLQTTAEFWLGRPLLVTRNDYVAELFNGDVGVVVAGEDGEPKVVFPRPGGVRYVAPARLPEHETVFAMTIHKSQGSEFEHAMVVLPQVQSPILTRELIYTGVTRAQKKMTLLGSTEILKRGLQETVRRASGLQREVWGA